VSIVIKELIDFIQTYYSSEEFIPLHAPNFNGNEKAYVCETIDSTFVSSVGGFVDEFENKIEKFTSAGKAIATVNGTAALQTALYMSNVQAGDLVITQALTFVATGNALIHMGSAPIFIDVDKESLSLCPKKMQGWLEDNAELDNDGSCIHRLTGAVIKAAMPMHTFGHPAKLDELKAVCESWNLILIEDAAESLGSFYKGRHTGTIGHFSALSFNGNKIITTGGGGMLLCRDQANGRRAKHITTTAKIPHPFEYYHDEPGFNYRLPNLNAALGCAQMEGLTEILQKKRELANSYEAFFKETEYEFLLEPEYASSNYWLNALICLDKEHRDELLNETNQNGVMTRPVWRLLNELPMFKNAIKGDLSTSKWFADRIVNIPSSPVMEPK
jgi:aminotransferase in exopolysaccharide biosynthesis